MCITAKCSYSIKIDSTITLGKIGRQKFIKRKFELRTKILNFDHLTNIANSLTKYLGIISKTEFFL